MKRMERGERLEKRGKIKDGRPRKERNEND